MAVPSPDELVETWGRLTPEQLATALGYHITRESMAPELPGVVVFSEYQPMTIILYETSLRQLARLRREPLPRLEQWHIAHELYHGLAETHGVLPWRIRETEADHWADELLTLTPVE